jgi:hypothetical protein
VFILKFIKKSIRFFIVFFLIFILPPLYFLLAIICRFIPKTKIGFGPEPLINNVHHKKALFLNGVEAETFVTHCYYITDEFDKIIDKKYAYFYFIYILFTYKAVFYYFNGGLLSFSHPHISLLSKLEPFFLKLAKIKIILIPYGGDVQNFKTYNDVVYKYAFISDYPSFVKYTMKYTEGRVNYWTKYADWIIAGCDWVQYLPYWDTLMLAHFSVDTKKWFPKDKVFPAKFDKSRPLKIIHAPNHTAIKGTDFIEKIIDELKADNYPIEYSRIQKIPNNEFISIVQNTDIVIDQMIVGWYGIFALEAMACKKPVLIYISPELERLYTMAGLLEPNELPCIKTDHNTLKNNIINIINNPSQIPKIGLKSLDFVTKHHSCEYIGKVFKGILGQLGCLD